MKENVAAAHPDAHSGHRQAGVLPSPARTISSC
jgi:hypothetical protein